VRQHTRTATAVATAAALAAAVPALLAPTAHADETDGAAPDLAISHLVSGPLKPGAVFDDTVSISNRGTAPANGVFFQVRLTRGLDFPEPVAGCTYTTDEQQIRKALCKLDTVVEPGATITTPVRFKALPHALMEAVEYGTSPTGEAPSGQFDAAYDRMTLTADSSADLVAVGDRAEAAPGDTVTVEATLRNDGPGWVQNQVSDDLPGLKVQIPPGTVAVEVPEECSPFHIDGPSGPSKPGKAEYVCWPQDATLDVGEKHAYAFKLKVKDGAKDTKGEVRAGSIYDITPKYDERLGNNTAFLRVDVTGDDDGSSTGGSGSTGGDGNDPEGQAAGGTGTSGSTGSTGSTGSGGSSGTSGSTGSTGTTGATAAGTSTGGSSTTGGSLASTGSDGTPLLAGAAAAAAAVGGLLVLAVRRRRASTESA
jgi:LPXTG-motif cell wall-anchored protein